MRRKIKLFIIRLFFTEYERMNIYQSLYTRRNKINEINVCGKYWDAYNYDYDLKELYEIAELFHDEKWDKDWIP